VLVTASLDASSTRLGTAFWNWNGEWEVANTDTEQDIKERRIYRMCAIGLMLGGWSIGLINLMGWARF
jgi:hypothetical protein